MEESYSGNEIKLKNMKVVAISNYCDELVSDILIKSELVEDEANKLSSIENSKNIDQRYLYVVVKDNYKLFKSRLV
jgi:hypothetical protein